ncbi:MAG: hypothetical protein CW338_08130 [Clostridiales bacterium]|nr:hypothetical protein [Clostridiales bacterium]
MLYVSAIVSMIITTAVTQIPAVAGAFGFAPVIWTDLLIAAGLGLCMIPLVELVKLVQRMIRKEKE